MYINKVDKLSLKQFFNELFWHLEKSEKSETFNTEKSLTNLLL